MTKTEEFWKWAEEEREKRNLSWYAIERQSGLSNATISRRARELLPPTYETCRAIAQVFRLPLENVLRYAGLLPPTPQRNLITAELVEIASKLDDDQLRMLVHAGRGLLRGSEREPSEAEE